MARKRVTKDKVLQNARKGEAQSLFSTLSEKEKQIAQVLVNDTSLMRTQLLNKLIDTRRDIDDECGYPKTLTTSQYKLMYDREGVSTRVVEIMPQESWAMDPEVYETEEPDETEFEKAWGDLQEERNIWAYLLRIDEISGIGRFGVLLLGFSDGKPLNEPIDGMNEQGEKVGNKEYELMYLRAFDESLVKVKTKEKDPTNPRFGQPTSYTITFENSVAAQTSSTTATMEQTVHWSRILHVADNRKTSEVYGIPRMQTLFNRLYDIRKTAGGSAEMFWKGAFPGYAFEVDPSLQGAELDTTTLRTEFENYSNGLQRYLAISGVSVKSLLPQMANPKDHLESQIKLIAIAMGIPYRVFQGSEEAKLAGAKDAEAWNKRVARRQNKYVTPYLIRTLVDRLIAVGALPEPASYSVHWPDLSTPSSTEKAEVLAKLTEAFAKYVGGNVDVLIPPEEFLTMFAGLDPDQVQTIMDAAMKRQETLGADEEEAEIARRAAAEEDADRAAERERETAAAAAAAKE